MMTWTTEEEFVDAFVISNYDGKSAKGNNIIVRREVRTGFGRPDIVVIEYNPEIVEDRTCEESIPLSSMGAYATTYLSGRSWVSMQRLQQFLNCTNAQVEGVVTELENRRLLIRNRHIVKVRRRKEILAIKRISVYEAKLSQWKNAIVQAQRHLWFTQDSFVLLPSDRAALIPVVSSECDKRGVGLSIFCTETGVRTVVRPQRSGVINSPMLWKLNESLIGGAK